MSDSLESDTQDEGGSSPEEETKRQGYLRLRVSVLEADVAYFQARLELLGEPKSLHQIAQYRAYRTMEELLRRFLRRIKRKTGPSGKGMNVEWSDG